MASWYTIFCAECDAEVHVCEDWSHTPRYCKSCKEALAAQWYEKSCEHCGATIKASRDWRHEPRYCKKCKEAYPEQYTNCEHCGERFTIYTSTQIRCAEKDWELPRKCSQCRELFRHTPYRIFREKDLLGGVVFRTYNNLGQVLTESRDAMTITGNLRRHTNRYGKTIAVSRRIKSVLGTPYIETRRPDGSVKSESWRRTIFGNTYTESIGGSSSTSHETNDATSWMGEEYRETR